MKPSVRDELDYDALPQEVRELAERVIRGRLEGELEEPTNVYDEGYETGLEEGKDFYITHGEDQYDEGYRLGLKEGREEAEEVAKQENQEAYEKGYDKGFQ